MHRALCSRRMRPIAAVALPARAVTGQPVTLDASGSAAACGSEIVSYQWSVINPAVAYPVIQNAGSAHASVMAPALGTIYTC